MIVIDARNVNDALVKGLALIREKGRPQESRNGPVMVMDEPVTTVYFRPYERVLAWAWRDANPFFHLYEALWMLAGKNDVKSVAQLVPRMATFSDDGVTFNGAYGYRWRNYFCIDQLKCVVRALRDNPDCRRQVITMSDPEDLRRRTNDVPCNIAVSCRVVEGKLDIYVFNRSNDIIWGAYGANAVHFSFLQEYLAGLVGVEVGIYEQISCNWHAYYDVLSKYIDVAPQKDPYRLGLVDSSPALVPHGMEQGDFDQILYEFVGSEPSVHGYDHTEIPFLNQVAKPMMTAWRVYKNGSEAGIPSRYEDAAEVLRECGDRDNDWIADGLRWLARRHEKANM